jgi:DNA-binding MarR family transcriptional regulator
VTGPGASTPNDCPRLKAAIWFGTRLSSTVCGYILVYVKSVEPENFVGCLAGNLRAAARLATRRYDAELRATGLRITQVAILAQVKRHQSLSLSELAAELSSERSVVARDVAILERDDLVTVGIDPDDRRARSVSLTKAGRAKLHAAAPAWRRAQSDMRAALGHPLADDVLRVSRGVVSSLGDS